jgi:DNA-directed RNA polymerase specialized sigma24 family protein
MPYLQQALDDEWETFRAGTSGARALASWAAQDPRYREFRDLGELRQFFEQRHDTDARDALLADLLHRCPADRAAQRVLLATLRPGLVRLSRRAAAFWEAEEAESIVVAAALDRLANRNITFPTHAAAGVLGSVWSAVWEQRRRERWEEDYWGRRAGNDALELVEAERHDTPTNRVVALVAEAVRRGAVPARGARLVILHWVHGYSNNEIADLDGLRPCTIRKHRRDAELRLAEFAA